MANLPPALAAKVGEARTAGGGNWIQHGDYVFMIKNWFYQKITDECIITELLVVEAKKKAVYEGSKLVEQEPNAIGSEASECVNFDGAGKLSAAGNARAVVLGLFGFTENEVPNNKITETLAAVTSDSKPAFGMLIGCSTYSKEKRNTKGEFITGRNWTCVAKPGEGLNSPEAVKARVDALIRDSQEAVKVATQQLQQSRGVTPSASSATPTAALPQTLFTAPAPSIPTAPQVPISAPPVDPFAAFQAAGWARHPQSPTHWYRQNEVKTEADLLAGR